MRPLLLGLYSALAILTQPALAAPLIQHQLQARLEPATGWIEAEDRLTLPLERTDWTLLLHSGLSPRVIEGNASLTPIQTQGHLALYRLLPRGSTKLTLAYSGVIRHELAQAKAGLGRSAQGSLGTIGPEGVFLHGASGWYPRIPGTLQTLELAVELPKGWLAISQGAGSADPDTGRARWRETQPQDELYLVAGRFEPYERSAAGFTAQVYLRAPDPGLAERYLAATLDYLALYSRLIGPYPYAKFALVENLWESGYGMPSFTLLGPRVIRLPFIIESAYPHEILHNWWGNGVYVDPDSGNWSEGLTHYLADYWLKERQGLGREMRCGLLKDFADYVQAGRDLPLARFSQRHDPATQAIGYGKSSLFWHMLRQRLGDERFFQGLRRFYAEHCFQMASYSDLRRAFEAVSGQDLGPFFAAWIEHTGAPRLKLSEVQLAALDQGYRLSARIDQTQAEPPFPLQVPVAIELLSGERRFEQVASNDRTTRFELVFESAPVRLTIDPDCDLFRELAPGEWPATLSLALGADQGLILIPAAAPEPLKSAYRALAESWAKTQPGWQVKEDRSVAPLPADRALWLLGWENRYLPLLAEGATDFELDVASGRLHLGATDIDPGQDSPVLVWLRRNQAIAWLATRLPESLPALARKVPHYGRYSYLVFAGPEATNRLKGLWPAGESALSQCLWPKVCGPKQ